MSPTPYEEIAEARQWVATRLAERERPEVPFSFTYDGVPSAELLPTWQFQRASRPLDDRRQEHTLTYTDPRTGLVLRCVAVEYNDFPVVEWTIYFQNTAATDTPILADIQAIDVRFQHVDSGSRAGERPATGFLLHHLKGDNCTPDSYQPQQTVLKPDSELCLAAVGGRPTQSGFPYFNVEWTGAGAIVAIGWPGQWAARFVCDGDGLRVCGGQEMTRFRLHPGEGVRTPLVVMLFWRGDRTRAQNIWRRWMLSHNMPRSGGKMVPPLMTACSGGFFPGLKCNEADELLFIEAYTHEGMPLNYWWMDAGWYPCRDWTEVGTWEVDRERFPRGLKAISDQAHARGMGLVLWFEPERVVPGTWLSENHPEWLLAPPDRPDLSAWARRSHLLDLGNAEARRWLIEHVDRLLVEQGVDLYRQDFNMDPLPHWRANDAADRQGITEINYVTGYLAYWDELLRRHPGMLIDTCASGGRRNDLETLRRAVPLLRSDYQSWAGDPGYAPGNQGHTYGLSAWIPYYGQGVYFSDNAFTYSARSSLSPAYGIACDVRRNDRDWAAIRKAAEDWRQVADYMLGDYYPLTAYSLDDRDWMAWQFNAPESGAGMVQVFRRAKSPFVSAQFPLHDLDPEATYEVTDLDAPALRQQFTGRVLMQDGLSVRLDRQPEAAILTYRQMRRTP